jgi:lipoprotein-releasing system permease protein
MGMQTSITQGYPVKVQLADFVITLLVISIITILIALHPARLASRIAAVKHL